MGKGFEEFQPIFGKAEGEWDTNTNSSSLSSSSPPFLPFLFHVHALDTYSLRFHVTDFHSHTWEATRSIQQLHDMRDNIGVGGSWLEFVDFLIESFKSDNVRLVMGVSKSMKFDGDQGALSGKLVAHKSKGMPRISISLHRLMDSSANDAMANLSLGLFKAFKSKHNLDVKGEEHCHQLAKDSSVEQASNGIARTKFDPDLFLKRQKLQELSSSNKALRPTDLSTLGTVSVSDKHESPRKPSTRDPHPTKVGKRAVPASRRAKVRGAVLGGADDDSDD